MRIKQIRKSQEAWKMKKVFAVLASFLFLVVSGFAVVVCNAGAAEPDGVITVAFPSLGATLDPVDNTDGITSTFIYATYDRLVRFAVNGDMADDKSYEPVLAESWEQSEDGLTWTFHLDKRARFANGDPVTAEDVAFSFKRCAERKNGEFVFRLTRIQETTIIDDHTIQFKLSQLCPTFMQLIEMYPFAICNKSEVEGKPDNWLADNTAGAGPYRIIKHDTAVEVILEARDDYWGSKPSNKKIIVQLVKEPSVRKMLIEKGDVDFVTDLTPVDLDGLENAKNVKILSSPSNTILFFGMNCKLAPFDNPLVRQAICYALPYDTLVSSVMNGRAKRMMSAIPSIMAGHIESEKTHYEYDLEKAKKLLAEAGFPDGFTFTFVLGSGFQDWEDDSVLIQAELAKIGVKMNINKMDRSQFLEVLRNRDKAQAYISRFISYVNDPGFATGMIMVSNGDMNYFNYGNKKFDEIHTQAEKTIDNAERMKLFGELQEIIAQDAPFGYLYEYNNTVAVRDNIDGFIFFPDRTTRFDTLVEK
jgi:peptide/nickel transport system substrate-binding protein